MNILFLTSAAPEKAAFSTSEKRPPLGLGILISVLKELNHKVYFSDQYLKQSNILNTDFLQKHKIDFVGIYSNTICYASTLRMIENLQELRDRQKWNGKIIIGGPHTSVGYKTIPDYVDYIVIGEGEISVPKILNGEVKERIIYGEKVGDLDSLPMPAWEEFIYRPYDWHDPWKSIDAYPFYTMITSRGCPFNCTFCSVKSIWGKDYRYMSAEKIVADIEYMIKYYGAKGIYFREDNFTLNKKRIVDFCNLVIKKNIRIAWMCETRGDSIDDYDYIKLMKDAGCKIFYIGVESGSQKMLSFFNKGETVEQFIKAFQLTKEVGIKTYASFIIEAPGETEEDKRLTNQLIEQIKPDFVGKNIFVGIPGSELYDHIKENRLYEFKDNLNILYPTGYLDSIAKHHQNSYFKVYNKEQIIEHKNTSEIYNDRYASGYREKISGYEFARWSALEHFVGNVINATKKARVLDYGSGSGLHINLWKQLFPESKLYFTDISTVAIEKLKSKYPEFQNNTCMIKDNQTPYSDNSFDIVISVEVMEHVENLDDYLREVYRILKTGGKFIWTTPCGNKFSIEHLYSHKRKLVEKTSEGYIRWKWEDPTHIRRLKSAEINSILLQRGFSKVHFRFRAHFFSFLCTKLREKKIIPEKLANKLMMLDYKLFRVLPNAASMIGCATK